MTKQNDNRKVTRKSLIRDIREQHARRLYNEQYNGRYGKDRKEVEFLDAILADNDATDWECQSEEDKRAREITATCLLTLVGRAGTDVGDMGGGSRPVVGGVPITPKQLTGG